ncbi:hypothetical protein [Embleya hyalina]|uniref:Uncharacterized protein n=1 Tax=Embleya hyalina TaxID=516124 RepID=A0A401YYU0_9ACTN|nr:hypothetical protein [Embleya hyalina]GCD99758.1 hypothetical protein EHYA_07480 [Embleya hyalina]
MNATITRRPPLPHTHPDTEAIETIIEPVYRERAQVVADLAARWPAVLVEHAPDLPEYAIVHVHGATGPMTWHVNRAHLDLFPHVRRVRADHPLAQWDGCATDEKYTRLQKLRAARDTAPRPVVGARTVWRDGRGDLWITSTDDPDRIHALTPEYAPNRWSTPAGFLTATGTLTALGAAR